MFVLNDGNERIKNTGEIPNEYVKTKAAGRAENIAEEYTKEEKARQKKCCGS